MRPRNSYREQLQQKIEAAKQPSRPAAPAPDPLPGFKDPDVRSELLTDQLRDARDEIARERAARQQAQARLAELEADRTEASSRAGFAHRVFNRPKSRRSWK